jgi:transaldolase
MEFSLKNLEVKIFADGANLDTMIEMSRKPYIQGLTTNPTLMHKAGVRNYKAFAKEVLALVNNKPISFEVFSDDFNEMIYQAQEIASWGNNVNVKIPITNTKGKESLKVIKFLSERDITVNVTAIMTISQVKAVVNSLSSTTDAFISIFAGRIADTGVNPIPIMIEALKLMKSLPNTSLIWASPRELLNVLQADSIGCHVITATTEILNKLDLIGKDLEEYSLETVRMFKHDAEASGYEV